MMNNLTVDHIDFSRMRNNDFFAFMANVPVIYGEMNLALSPIQPEKLIFDECFKELDKVMTLPQSSRYTSIIRALDIERDKVVRGFYYSVKAGLNHYSPGVRALAAELQRVINTFGNVWELSYKEETSAITNMIQEVKAAADYYETPPTIFGLKAWTDAMSQANVNFEAAWNERNYERSEKELYKVKAARFALEEQYYRMIRAIEGGLILGTEQEKSNYERFILALNVQIKTAEWQLNIREAKMEASKDKEEEEEVSQE